MRATRPLAGLLALLLCGTAWADGGDIRCMRSVNLKTPARLQFTFPAGNSDRGYVLYERGSAPIPVKAMRTESVETAPGRPHEFTTTWKEIGPLGGGGTYTVISQGARIYGFTYLRAKDRGRVEFMEDFEAQDSKGCVWKQP